MRKLEVLGHCPLCARFAVLLFVVPDADPPHAVCARCNGRWILAPGEARDPVRYGYFPIGAHCHVETT